MPHGSCSFKNSWLQDGAYKLWVYISPLGKIYAGCKLCNKYDINQAVMGKSALVSHAGGRTHKDLELAAKTATTSLVPLFFKKRVQITSESSTTTTTATSVRVDYCLTSTSVFFLDILFLSLNDKIITVIQTNLTTQLHIYAPLNKTLTIGYNKSNYH